MSTALAIAALALIAKKQRQNISIILVLASTFPLMDALEFETTDEVPSRKLLQDVEDNVLFQIHLPAKTQQYMSQLNLAIDHKESE